MLTHLNMVVGRDARSPPTWRHAGRRAPERPAAVVRLRALPGRSLAFKVGATLVLERSFAFPHAVLETLVAERVTGFPMVPTMAAVLLQLDLAQVRPVRGCATSPTPPPPCRPITSRGCGSCFPARQTLSRCTGRPSASASRTCRRSSSTCGPARSAAACPTRRSIVVDEQGERVGAGRRRRARGARLARDAGLLGAARGDRTDAAARPASRRARAVHRRPVPDGRGGLSLLRRPQGRHHQDARREGQPRKSRTSCYALDGVAGGGGGRGARSRARSGREGGRGHAREGAALDGAGCAGATAPGTSRTSWCRRVVEFREELPKTATGKITQAGAALAAPGDESRERRQHCSPRAAGARRRAATADADRGRHPREAVVRAASSAAAPCVGALGRHRQQRGGGPVRAGARARSASSALLMPEADSSDDSLRLGQRWPRTSGIEHRARGHHAHPGGRRLLPAARRGHPHGGPGLRRRLEVQDRAAQRRSTATATACSRSSSQPPDGPQRSGRACRSRPTSASWPPPTSSSARAR